MENTKIFGSPVDIATPVSSHAADTPISGATPDSMRSPRHKPSTDSSVSSYSKSGYNASSSGPPSREGLETGFGPSQHMYKENGSGSYNDSIAAQGRNRNVYSSNTQSNLPMSKQAKRESNTLFMNLGPMGQREPALSRLRETENFD